MTNTLNFRTVQDADLRRILEAPSEQKQLLFEQLVAAHFERKALGPFMDLSDADLAAAIAEAEAAIADCDAEIENLQDEINIWEGDKQPHVDQLELLEAERDRREDLDAEEDTADKLLAEAQASRNVADFMQANGITTLSEIFREI